MENKTRRKKIFIETHSITVIRINDKALSVVCERCQKTVAAFSPEQFALSFRLSLTEVCRRVEVGEIHLTSSKRGAALICGDSFGKKN